LSRAAFVDESRTAHTFISSATLADSIMKLASSVLLSVLVFAPALQAAPAPNLASTNAAQWNQPLAGDKLIAHALNRLSFGPRPGDIERVRAVGLNAWIESQLAPQGADPIESQIARLPMLNASPARLRLAYEADSGAIRRILDERAGRGNPQRRTAAVGADEAMKTQTLRAARADELVNARRERLIEEIEESGLERGASLQAVGELAAAKLARAVDSKHQTREVLADFWSNHFNVDAKKGPVRAFVISAEQRAIRPHVFTTFRQMLGASAQSPAMLWYLDNHRSTAQQQMGRGGRTRGGLNENYARELMELHTLGVDGGYTQTDVTEVARCFTGWGVQPNGSGFRFNARAHDNGTKRVLGQVIPANGGIKDGERVLDILANHPSTAKFLARKLCVRFVADAPPEALVERVAREWMRSRGDLTAIYRAIFTSPEFRSVGAYRSKIKSPFEFAVSATRALDGHFEIPDATNPRQRLWLVALGSSSMERPRAARLPRKPLGSEIAAMGQPLWSQQAPTGYPEDSTRWVSSGALVSRLNFALALTAGRVGDVRLKTDTFRPAPTEELARDLLAGDWSDATRKTIETERNPRPETAPKFAPSCWVRPNFNVDKPPREILSSTKEFRAETLDSTRNLRRRTKT
jgi:uncharacterized protein (DUF1800 family)